MKNPEEGLGPETITSDRLVFDWLWIPENELEVVLLKK